MKRPIAKSAAIASRSKAMIVFRFIGFFLAKLRAAIRYTSAFVSNAMRSGTFYSKPHTVHALEFICEPSFVFRLSSSKMDQYERRCPSLDPQERRG